ncbi:MAG: endo-1,4-beta-D-glucanase Y [Alteromonadaceae bacterium]|jgi:endo-1,4-beta-D-glucanase Y
MKLKTITRWVSILTITLQSTQLFAVENYPFPQNIDYFGLSPNNQSTAQQNSEVQAFYDYWKNRYLKQATTGGYYVHGADTDGQGKGTSESHGYGMLLTALMAGYDVKAKQEFDGLYNFFNTHRSSINRELMGWFINKGESGTGTYSSATDGDMDIAYALLVADKQWGSTGTINYKKEAIDMINNGLRINDYHGSSKRLMLGDWDSKALTTRSSDWMTGHLRAFEQATGDKEWLSAIDEIYIMVGQLNSKNNNTGLMPDFVTGLIASPDLTNENGTGEQHSGDYYYNGARTPLRLAMDYIHNGNSSAKQASDKLTLWTKQQIGAQYNFNNYFAGYTIQGVALPSATYSSSVFVAPIVIAASVDHTNQAFVNAGWNYMKSNKESYFEDSINLLSMLAITGNWWAPNQMDGGSDGVPVATNKSITTAKNTLSTVVLDGVDNGSIVGYNIVNVVKYGVVTLKGNQASYIPTTDYVGTDSFTYTVTDDEGLTSQPASVEIVVVDNVTPALTCEVTESVWNGGFVANVTLKNDTDSTINDWKVTVILGNNETFTSGWSAIFDTSTAPITANALSWNKTLVPGANVTFGLQGSNSGDHTPVVCQ